MRRMAAISVFLLSCLVGVSQSRPVAVSPDDLAQYSTQPKSLADLVEPSADIIVLIRTEEGSGTGFFATLGGWIVTARHVILLKDGTVAKQIFVSRPRVAEVIGGLTVKESSMQYEAKLVADDPDHDLAIVRVDHNPFTQPSGININGVDPDMPHHVAAICPRRITLRAGDPVFTVGYPLREKRAVTTAGIIASSHPNDFDASGKLRGTYLVDMVINHGNSGGPVFASPGCVIGVADAITEANVEAIGDFNLPEIDLPRLGPDGKPAMKGGKPLMTTLYYNSGLGILIPQRYVLELLDRASLNATRVGRPAETLSTGQDTCAYYSCVPV